MIQILINVCISASIYALVAVGIGITLQVAKYFNFAYGLVYTFGAYTVYVFHRMINQSIIISIIMAIIITALLGCLLEICMIKSLRLKRASPEILLLVSIGIYIIGQGIISIIFGDSIIPIRKYSSEKGIDILGGRITQHQIAMIIVSTAVMILIWIVVRYFRIGKEIRATSSDEQLAIISGIRVDRIVIYSIILGSASAGLSGVLAGLDVGITPTMGIRALMMGVVVVLIGGIGRITGVVLGALFLGLVQHTGIWIIDSKWQDAIAFIILLVFLLLRPQGILGKKMKKVEL